MTEPTQSITLNDAIQLVQRMREQIARVVVGQQQVIDQVLIAMLASGHVLVEGVPGLGKTLLVKALAKCFHGQFGRIQFTPDLMPSDVTGHALYDMKTEQFIPFWSEGKHSFLVFDLIRFSTKFGDSFGGFLT